MNKQKGSEWRKWDLHVHTPASFYFNGTKKYREMSTAEKNAELKIFIDTVNQSDVAVFCLMDYWTFDWYLELQNYVTHNPGELKKTIFPGMELRIESPTNYRLNIHVVLSDKLSKQELLGFKSELYIRSIDKKLSDDALIRFAKSLDESKAAKHGYANPDTLDDDRLLQLGSQTAEITKESLNKAFGQIPLETGFVILPYDTSDGLLDLNWEAHPHADNYFMQSAQIFETRDQRNIDLISGIRTSENEKYFENFYKTLGSQAKPCISGSDAHKYSDYGKYPSNRVTWIKADPTFEGLKQIIYEPEQRVKIQKEKPDFKEEKLVIDEVRFISSNNKFTKNSIFFNDNLNVIIGGKSSGKSILLYNIAKTLLADKEFLKKENIESKYDFIAEDSGYNFEIKTKGGFTQLMHRVEAENSIIPTIKYIPQNYLVKLAEPEQTKSGNALNKIIRDLINEDSESKLSYENFISEVQATDRKRENLIDDYFELQVKISQLESQLMLKTNKDILEGNISSNTMKVEQLNKSIGMSSDQILKYNELQNQLEKNSQNRTQAINDFKKINDFNSELLTTLTSLKTKKELVENSLNTELLKNFFNNNYTLLGAFIESTEKFISNFETTKNESGGNSFKFESTVSNVFRNIREINEALKTELEPYLNNQEVKKQIELITNSISEDKEALQSINQLNKEINDNRKALEDKKDEIFKLYEDNHHSYVEVIDALKIRTVDLEKDSLKIEGLIAFNFPKFRKAVVNFSDGRSSSYSPYTICDPKRDSLFNYQLTDLISELKLMFASIAESESYVLSSKSQRKSAIKILLDDYFFDYWQVEFKNDKLGKMSTGKASFVILMLIVGLSKSKAPILIDQPEDNLDNRSITTDLVEYLKNKKLERQIILVTHNANVVVNADAENIIVANQKGQGDIETSSPFQFDYVVGSLENTFPTIPEEKDILKSMGIREHIADIVEGGRIAFQKREEKYGFKARK